MLASDAAGGAAAASLMDRRDLRTAATPEHRTGAATGPILPVSHHPPPPQPSTVALTADDNTLFSPAQRPPFAAAASKTTFDFLYTQSKRHNRSKQSIVRCAAGIIENISSPFRAKRQFDAIDDNAKYNHTVANHEPHRPVKRIRSKSASNTTGADDDWPKAATASPTSKPLECIEGRKDTAEVQGATTFKRKAEEDLNTDSKRFRAGGLCRFPRVLILQRVWKYAQALNGSTLRSDRILWDWWLPWRLLLKRLPLYRRIARLHGLHSGPKGKEGSEIIPVPPTGIKPKHEAWVVTPVTDKMDISLPQLRTAIAPSHQKMDFTSTNARHSRGDASREMQGAPWMTRVLARGQESAMYYDKARMGDSWTEQTRIREQTRIVSNGRNDDIARARQARHEEKLAAMARVVSNRGQESTVDRKENDERIARKKKLAGKWFGVNRGARQDGYKTTQTLYGEEITIRLGELHFARREEDLRSKLQKDLQLPDGLKRQKVRKGPLIVKLSDEWEDRIDNILAIRDAAHSVGTSTDGVTLSRKDIGRIIPGEPWLNDEVVNAWYSNLVTKLNLLDGYDKTNKKKAAEQVPRWAAYQTQWYTNATSARGVRSIKTWSRRKGIEGARILKTERIFFPTNTGAHWTLLAISGNKRTIEYLDSMNRDGFDVKLPIGLAKAWLSMELGEDYQEEEWKVLRTSSSQQNNTNDCGVFACLNGLALATGVMDPSKEFRAADMPGARRLMAATLINGSFNDEMYNETFLDVPELIKS